MQVYGSDRYENWDEYEEDGEEQEEEEVSEDRYVEAQQPSKEALEYLELRKKLKERYRRKIKKDLGAVSGNNTNGFRKDSYGSFFGPSQPVISQRVIQESKTLLENPELAARICRPKNTNTIKRPVPAHLNPKPQANHPAPRIHGLKKKAEILRHTRDYSFLQSDGPLIPAPAKNNPVRNPSAPRTGAVSAQPPARGKPAGIDHGRELSRYRDVKRPIPGNDHSKPEAAIEKMSKLSAGARSHLGSNHANGHGLPASNHATGHGLPASIRNGSSNNAGPASRNVTTSSVKKVVSSVPKSNTPSGVRKPMPPSVQSSNHRPAPSNVRPPAPSKPLLQRKEYHGASNSNVGLKQAPHPHRDQFNKPPSKPSPRVVDERPRVKPSRPLHHDDEANGEDARAISMIRKMFGYNPKRFRDDDDDSDMEAGFEDIMREERKSAKIARKEDEEQLRLIEEEERRERMRLKKRRLS